MDAGNQKLTGVERAILLQRQGKIARERAAEAEFIRLAKLREAQDRTLSVQSDGKNDGNRRGGYATEAIDCAGCPCCGTQSG